MDGVGRDASCWCSRRERLVAARLRMEAVSQQPGVSWHAACPLAEVSERNRWTPRRLGAGIWQLDQAALCLVVWDSFVGLQSIQARRLAREPAATKRVAQTRVELRPVGRSVGGWWAQRAVSPARLGYTNCSLFCVVLIATTVSLGNASAN